MPTPSDDLADLIGQLIDPADILAKHVNVNGRCKVCMLPGQAAHDTWPCRLHRLASQAQAKNWGRA